MKLSPLIHRNESGTAVIAVMIILATLAAFVAANGVALHSLRQEMRLIEKQQLKKWSAAPAGETNAPPSAPR